MTRFGHNVENYFEKHNRSLSKQSVLAIGLATIEALENVHSAGYVYNDLKLDNLMIGFNESVNPSKELCSSSLHMVDFGFASRYIDSQTQEHIEQGEVETFQGNLIFGSLNQLKFKKTSRRDDMISLCYMLVYLMNNGQMEGIDLEQQMSNSDAFKLIQQVKKKHSLRTLCQGNAEVLT